MLGKLPRLLLQIDYPWFVLLLHIGQYQLQKLLIITTQGICLKLTPPVVVRRRYMDMSVAVAGLNGAAGCYGLVKYDAAIWIIN